MQGKSVLITGASRGIGEAAAREFARLGAKVAVMARSREAVERIAAEIGGMPVVADVSDWEAVRDGVDRVAAQFGGLDVLINNAGAIEPVASLRASDPGDWGRIVDVNLKGVYYGMRAALKYMTRGGTVLTVSSGAAHRPLEGWSHYCASKAAVHMLTQSLDLEERANGIRAIGLSPGTVATQMQREIKASGVNPVSRMHWEDHIPPEWPAKALVWMCGPEADAWLGKEVLLRDEEIRKQVGLTND